MEKKVALDPYMFFAGNCREAMQFYESVFGGTLKIQTYDEVPGEKSEAMKGKVMHASLMDGEANLMASDSPDPDSLGTGKINLSLSGFDEEKLRTMFGRLSAGGKVNSPLKKEFWGDTFGTLTDKFGVDWMVNIAAGKPS
ncbi:MAG: VOC family protein [bacterium]